MQAQKKPILFPRAAKRPMQHIDADMIAVEHNTPIPKNRRIVGKYDDKFDTMEFGSCIRCEPSEKETVANAMRKYLERKGRPGKVAAVKRCEDGHARVWLLEP